MTETVPQFDIFMFTTDYSDHHCYFLLSHDAPIGDSIIEFAAPENMEVVDVGIIVGLYLISDRGKETRFAKVRVSSIEPKSSSIESKESSF